MNEATPVLTTRPMCRFLSTQPVLYKVPISPARRTGFALVIVLAFIVLLSALVVGLLTTAEHESKTNSLQVDSLDARIAAESALRLVQAQIRAASLEGIDSAGRGSHAWASQPGAVRTYDSSGAPANIYKLYSSEEMTTSDAASLAAEIPPDWKSRPEEFIDLNEPVHRSDQWIYPIAAPEALGTVAGFTSARTDDEKIPYDDRLAMPVRWLYLMKDGSLSVNPADGSPIIRFAFWSDDESCKVNLNTASATDAQSYWDIPRATYNDDLKKYAFGQPSQNEFNRYPGHPAMVSLQTIFPSSTLRELIEATPRYRWGGSENGAKIITDSRTSLTNDKTDRLYPSSDEYLYQAGRSTQLGLNTSTLESRRFFLSTSSRSSDLNLFGQPRVTIWPISAQADDLHRTPYDNLIAFCSTIGNGSTAKPYYFVRNNPRSQTDDWTLYPRNQELFSYLQTMTGRDIPGFGGNYSTKYPEDRNQILTEIFDYIRCVNLNETYKGQPANFVPYTTKLQAAEATTVLMDAGKGAGWVLPIRIDSLGTRGAGRVPVISEAAIWLIQTKNADGTSPSPPEVQPGLILETFSPMLGFMTWNPYFFNYEVRNIQAPLINGRRMFKDDETVPLNQHPGGGIPRSQAVGGTDGWGWMLGTGGSGTGNYGQNPFLTKKLEAIPATGGNVVITAGEIEVRFKSNTSSTKGSGEVFQSYRIQIPSATLPVPDPVTLAGTDKDGWVTRATTTATEPPRIFQEDVVRGLTIRDGDYRSAAYLQNVPAQFFVSHPGSGKRAHGLRQQLNAVPQAFLDTTNGGYIAGLTFNNDPYFTSGPLLTISGAPKISPNIKDLLTEGWEGDFDNGMAGWVDGPYLNKSDEGTQQYSTGRQPYYFERWKTADGLFSPSRQIPSAVMFGSLPTGVKVTEQAYLSNQPEKARPWRTLNFCPIPLAGSSHFGLSDPPDALLLDLFTIPIVEPYAISEPFSTAGRLNLNRQIVPFQYIRRDTALCSALAAQQVIAIADSCSTDYKKAISNNPPKKSVRFPVDIPETLRAMDQYLVSKNRKDDIFRSPAEICGVPLIPAGVGCTADNVTTWWKNYRLTGNNSRERPYATLYPLLTTRSNTFTTYVRAQAIKRTPSGKILVRSDFRGSFLFERFLDPNDSSFSTGAVNPDARSLELFFRFRTLLAKQFDL